MQELEIETVADADLSDPVFVEGLPGVGHVGKLVAEHIVEEGESTLVRRVYSEHFPPQVTVGDGGVAELAHVEVHAVETDGRDLLVLTGDHQAQENAGHYRVTDAFLDIAEGFGATELFALGGVPTGELIEEYGVVGAVSDDSLTDDLEDAGVEFRSDEPAGGIVGTSGLLLGLGGRRGFDCRCLMGETSGYLVDPRSARAVLETLEDLLEFELGYDSLDDRAEEMEEVMEKLHEMEGGAGVQPDDDLRYIG